MEANRKRAKVHRVPTENEGVIISDVGPYDTDMIPTSEVPKELRSHDRPHNHLYFTTDEEIKEGNWYYSVTLNNIFKATNKMLPIFGGEKIIATTDPELYTEIDNGFEKSTKRVKIHLPQPSQAFIEAYCKKGGIDEVLVEVENYEILKARQLGVNSHLDAINSINSSIFPQPKLNPDNTIIIHPVEEKTYSRDEAIELIENYRIYAWKKGLTVNDFDKWIEENL